MLSTKLSVPQLRLVFFNDTATTEIYTLSLHDALPISLVRSTANPLVFGRSRVQPSSRVTSWMKWSRARSNASCPRRLNCSTVRSEEHTSELQSRQYLVCRLLLDKKKKVCSLPIAYCQF